MSKTNTSNRTPRPMSAAVVEKAACADNDAQPPNLTIIARDPDRVNNLLNSTPH